MKKFDFKFDLDITSILIVFIVVFGLYKCSSNENTKTKEQSIAEAYNRCIIFGTDKENKEKSCGESVAKAFNTDNIINENK